MEADLHAPASPTVVVIGAGPAGLMAAETLAESGASVTVYDRMPSVGRKFLMAGRGGLNLTHGEPLAQMLRRYGNAEPRLRDALAQFPPERLRAWCEALGQPTFVGSSGRVFPVAMKASPLLRAWLRRLDGQGVRFTPRHRWTGWTADGALRFETTGGTVIVSPEATVLAMGGASWPSLGSDGAWVAPLEHQGFRVAALQPANCGFAVAWSAFFRDRFEGTPLKNIAVRFGGQRTRGDVMVTRVGLEGGALYGVAAALRDGIGAGGSAALEIDLRPDLPLSTLAGKLAGRQSRQSLSTALRKALHLAPAAIALLNEAVLGEADTLQSRDADRLATLIKAVPVRLVGVASLDRAISTAGGLTWEEVDTSFMLRRRPGTFVAGEMLDWEAPTGGYLLQACFATGAAAARGVLARAGSSRPTHRDGLV